MSVIIDGTFAIGWSSHIVDSMKKQGYDVIGDPPFEDPFALLLHRIKHPESIVIMTKLDIIPKHPEVVSVLQDLAEALLPRNTIRYGLVFDADPHEYFGKCIEEGYTGTFEESKHFSPYPKYLSYTTIKKITLPAYVADMPDILGGYLTRELETVLI